MKAIMYHYIRPENPELPYAHYLHIENFIKQIEYFGNKYGFVGRKEFEDSIISCEPAKGVILTFDDGFKGHYQYVFKELKKYNLWGIFFLSTAPFMNKKLLDVHRIHMLIGKYSGRDIVGAMQGIIDKSMLSHEHIKEFNVDTYARQDNDTNINYVKRLLNYLIDYKHREDVINQLMLLFYPDESKIVSDFYMTKSEINEMYHSGMVIGSHTVNHPIMSKLSIEDQEREIVSSFDTLESIIGENKFKTFCYPYGGFHTFTAETEELLEKNACFCSFNVDPRDISHEDLIGRRQALPRYDCNEFPYGRNKRMNFRED